jgi:phytoene synthase
MDNNKNILKKNSKTFYVASLFLPKKTRDKVLTVYAFCRLYDDNVDCERSIDTKDLENSIKRYGIETPVINQLKDGISSDMYSGHITSFNDLLNYCYKVAGCVGIMMCDVLDIKNKEAKYHAIDLGIAMQITNICRDINEDLLMNRVYLPKDKISKDEILNHDNDKIYEVTSDLIRLSNDYYSSALEGIKYIPLGSRFSILYALQLYKEIGHKILKNKKTFVLNKVNTSKFDKVKILVKTFYMFVSQYLFCSPKNHNQSLHSSLKGLPNTHERV